MKDKKQEQKTEAKVKNKWSVFKNKGPFGDYYSIKNGEQKININCGLLLDLINRANSYFEKEKLKSTEKKEGEQI